MRASPSPSSTKSQVRTDDVRAAGCRTLVDLLRFRAADSPEFSVYRFLPGDRKPEQAINHRQLHRRAMGVAARIAEIAKPGARVMLLVPPGLDYVAAYFGCLYAGVIAVPAYPPHPRRPDPRVSAIVADCEPEVALTTKSLLDRLESWRGDDERLRRLFWIAVDDIGESDSGPVRPVTEGDIAMLQYTSGSTAAPRGVVLTHRNLMHNLSLIRAAYPLSADDLGLLWLPPFHDMGLIGGILQPLHLGIGSVLMASATFLQRPLSWLEAITTFRATSTAAPNFAFDLCVDRIKPEEMRGLDLSRWHTVFDGAEPIRAETIDRFARAFAPAGFRRDAFFPCYGLAEATLYVAGGPWGQGASTLDVSRAALEQKRIAPATAGDRLRLVASGAPSDKQIVRIVDPETSVGVPDRRIGENLGVRR